MAQDKLYVPKYPGQGSPQGVGRPFTQSRGGGAGGRSVGYISSKGITDRTYPAGMSPYAPPDSQYITVDLDKKLTGTVLNNNEEIRGRSVSFWFKMLGNNIPITGSFDGQSPMVTIKQERDSSYPRSGVTCLARTNGSTTTDNKITAHFGQTVSIQINGTHMLHPSSPFGSNGKTPNYTDWFFCAASYAGPGGTNSNSFARIVIAAMDGTWWKQQGNVTKDEMWNDYGNRNEQLTICGCRCGNLLDGSRAYAGICQLRCARIEVRAGESLDYNYPYIYDNAFFDDGVYLQEYDPAVDEAYHLVDAGGAKWYSRAAWMFDTDLNAMAGLPSTYHNFSIGPDGEHLTSGGPVLL